MLTRALPCPRRRRATSGAHRARPLARTPGEHRRRRVVGDLARSRSAGCRSRRTRCATRRGWASRADRARRSTTRSRRGRTRRAAARSPAGAGRPSCGRRRRRPRRGRASDATAHASPATRVRDAAASSSGAGAASEHASGSTRPRRRERRRRRAAVHHVGRERQRRRGRRRARRDERAGRRAPHEVRRRLRRRETTRELALAARRDVVRADRPRVQEEERGLPRREHRLAVDDLADLADDPAHRAHPRLAARRELAGDRAVHVHVRVRVDAAVLPDRRAPRSACTSAAAVDSRSSPSHVTAIETDARASADERAQRSRPGRRRASATCSKR